ncbi:hypothetical protein [Variovorax sp. R-27]|uniref:hypothetical protein n=1 Tax=Variovorax sp. R-27 TaxID=3404058 RepID=UPI003CE7B44E
MLILLNTGWVAHRFGQWRWLLHAVAGVVFLAIGWAAANIVLVVQSLAPTAESSAAGWTFLTFAAAGFILLLYSIWLSYIDSTRQAYRAIAERYRRDGW